MDVLARSLADGGTDALLATYDAYADQLYAYSVYLLADSDDGAAAVYDAFLVAVERAPSLPDDSRLCPWLFALTRNECLRRLRRGANDPRAEVTKLAGYGLDSAETAAILGVDARETARVLALNAMAADAAGDRAAPIPVPPPGLRDRLAAAGSAAAGQRVALAQRAGPFRPDGFPQALDRRRLSARVLVATIVVAVLGTFVGLVAMPEKRSGSAQPLLAGAGGVAQPIGQPAAPGAAVRSFWPAPKAAPVTSLRPAGQPDGRQASGPAIAGPAEPAPRQQAPQPGQQSDQAPSTRTIVSGWLENRTAPACPQRWTARVHVMVVGLDATQVVATWYDGDQLRTVLLQHRDRDWVGEFYRVPVGKQLWWRAGATAGDGRTATSARQSLSYNC